MLFDRTTNPHSVALAAIALAAGLAGSAVAQEASPPKPVEAQPTEQPKEAKKVVPDLGVVAGWNGDHFFLRNADGSILFIPYGFVQTDYRLYSGDGVPANTFAIRSARAIRPGGRHGQRHQHRFRRAWPDVAPLPVPGVRIPCPRRHDPRRPRQ